MKLQILQENLAKAILTASRFSSSKAQLPVLGNLHLKAKKNQLLINATNLEISISIALGAQIRQDGEITIPAKIFTEVVSNLPKNPINFEVEKEQLKITSENFSSTISGMNAGDFPKVPEALGKNKSILPAQELVKALDKIIFSISIDESRPYITGALFIFEGSNLTVVGTDGFRLSRKKISIGEVESFRVIVPRNILMELARIQDVSDLGFEYKKDDNQIVFGMSGVVLSSRVIAGDFPPFEKIIPKDKIFTVETDVGEFLRFIKLSSVFARDSANVMKLKFGKKGINILSESKLSGQQKSFVDARVEGEPFDEPIAFNFRFLEELLGVIEAESVVMEFQGSNAPGVFRDPRDKNFLHLIMPVKIQD